MAAEYILELFPTDGNWDNILKWFGDKTEIVRNNDNAGVDMFCSKSYEIGSQNEITLIDLGVKARMFKNSPYYTYGAEMTRTEPCHFWLAPRSSIWKNGVIQANSLGVIDSSYRGPLMGAVLPIKPGVTIQEGTRLFQILAPDMGNITKIIIKPESHLDMTSRGSGGFGSTGVGSTGVGSTR